MAEVRAGARMLSIHSLEEDTSVICSVDGDLRIAYCNRAWDEFAKENGGAGLDRDSIRGREILDFIAPPLRDYYGEVFGRVVASGQGWEHAYECSSASLFRIFHMWIRPLTGSGGLLMVHALRIQRPHGAERPASPALDEVYVSEGIVTMCCHCRRTKHPAGTWDWVPEYLNAAPALVSHGICPGCAMYFYPDLANLSGDSGLAPA
jgi:hypothetical protein